VRKIRILLAEDNRADIGMVREALNAHRIAHELHVAVNGEEALAFVARMGKPDEPACPDLLLLDLNLPRADGLDVLREFRRHTLCATTPVIVMSSSNALRDREAAGTYGVTCYFAKPMSYEEFIQLGQLIKDAVGAEISS
jgi:chemotaxis family two-component system response regulator Rcp1